MASGPGWFGRRRRRDATASGHPGLEARHASDTDGSAERVAGLPDPLPLLDRAVTVLLVSRSDRYAALPAMVVAARVAFGPEVDVRAVGYVADASPRDRQQRGVPWVREDPVDGIGSAINAGVAAGVGRVLVVVDSTVGVTDQDLQVLVPAGRERVAQARVWTSDGGVRHGVRLLRPGALPWTDDGAQQQRPQLATRADVADAVSETRLAEGIGVVPVFAADQPVLSMPGAALVPAPCLPDERMTLTAWTRAVADRTGNDPVVTWAVERSAEAGRTVDAATVDAFTAWRDRASDASGSAVAAGPPLPPWGARPVTPVPAVARDEDRGLTWSLKIAAPAGAEGDGWGDVHFAAELAGALERLGQHVSIDRRDAHVRDDDDAADDVTLVIRGLDRVPPNPASVNLLWVISHPDDVTDTELRSFDVAFAAGPVWADAAAARSGVPVRTLLQATDPAVFRPASLDPGAPDAGHVVFVGSTRGAARPVVTDAVALGADLRVHGPGWRGVVPDAALGAPSLSRAEVARSYASARVVLNDHWADMAAGGFVSNRVFDVLASGGVVVTDEVAGLAEVLDIPTLAVARSRDELAALLDPSYAWPTAAERAAVAEHVAAEHSFDARARVLLEAARAERARLRP
ncbi:glycosyltransferase [Curtobacterium sp. PhB115]|uniref:glycosyltransferase n=1 Tax=Curtobacterium sp. PhB115 TaxID=2485173 RepID=UPI000F4BE9E6|nr:glycosyltransferase [Curtobacterium sp. PhB115]ROP64328.1 glycosyl transferase family 1 [Curtobacterium sp. PhB115]